MVELYGLNDLLLCNNNNRVIYIFYAQIVILSKLYQFESLCIVKDNENFILLRIVTFPSFLRCYIYEEMSKKSGDNLRHCNVVKLSISRFWNFVHLQN